MQNDNFYTPASDDAGAYSFSVFRTCVCAYHCKFSVQMCVRTYVHTYVCDPFRLRLRHLYQVECCSFIVGYPTAGASVCCGHISSCMGIPALLTAKVSPYWQSYMSGHKCDWLTGSLSK